VLLVTMYLEMTDHWKMISGVAYYVVIPPPKKSSYVRVCTVWDTLDKFYTVQRRVQSCTTCTQNTDYLIPELISFEERMKHRCLEATITSAEN
jgi:hypothetical protein